MEKHECYIGLWNDDYTRLITFEEIIDIVDRNVIDNLPKDYEKS